MSRDESRKPETSLERGKSREPGEARDAVAKLLEIAGPRPAPPELVRRQIRKASHAAWLRKVEEHREHPEHEEHREPAGRRPRPPRRQPRRQLWRLAAAAVVAVGLAVTLWLALGRGPVVPGPTVATLEALYGAVEVRGANAGAVSEGSIGATLPAGTVLETAARDAGNGRAALRLAGGSAAGGTAVRLDAGSRLVLASARELVLERGAVYLDTAVLDTGVLDTGAQDSGSRGQSLGNGSSLAVRTAYGVARDVGTQFEVRVGEEALQVRVREGRVEVDTGAETHAAAAGVALRVDARGRAEREPIAAHGRAWSWILDTTPPFELEGKTLAQYLDWLARETGWRVEYEDPELRREASEITVHGSVEELRPDETPEMVLPGAALDYRLEGGTLVVGR